jgi:enterochelin esterase family protein
MDALAVLFGLAGDVRVISVESPALAGNPLGDPATRPLAVYVPPGYDPQGSARYPVLYCLHGYSGDITSLLSTRPWQTNVFQWADRLIRAGRMPPVLVAIVDGFTRLGGSQYVDSIHNGAYATYVVRDAVAAVDGAFRTIARPGGRAVFGKSSGGFGALHVTMRHPGVFAAFAAHSADAYFRYAHPALFVHAQRTLEDFASYEAFVAAFETRHKKPPAWFSTMELLAYAAAYSPAAARPFAIDLPYDAKTGELREAVFERWLAFDPVEDAPRREAALRELRLRFVDCGRRDQYLLDAGARVFVARLREMGLDVRHEEFDDDHGSIGYRHEISLPALAAVLDRA